jgi:lipid-binding SYLF domain-containing protein
LTDFVLVLNTKEAVKTFSQGGNVTLGGNVSGKQENTIVVE